MIRFEFCVDVPDDLLRYAVIAARHGDRWVFCKHRERSTYELPGGRREEGEAIGDTARRELWEETGAARFSLEPIGPYGVFRDGTESYGMLYYSEIAAFGPLPPLEIERIELLDAPPESWTYPEIQPLLLAEARERCARQGKMPL